MGVCNSKCSERFLSQGEIVLANQSYNKEDIEDINANDSFALKNVLRGYFCRKSLFHKKTRVLGKILLKKPNLSWVESRALHDGLYTGQMQNEKKHGLGELTIYPSSYYYGYFSNGLFEGLGILTTSDSTYEGNFLKGKKSGYGSLTSKKTSYTGHFSEDLYQGQGTEIWHNNCKYTGDFVIGKKHGKGRCEFANGDIYEGEFFNSKFSGTGTFYWQSGKKYAGQWKDGLMHGDGHVYWANGNFFKGSFNQGKKQGHGMLYKDGKTVQGWWENGKRLKESQ
ncbi:hypothetical protein SteCoe_15637 [Stentor coeruleus]|uniref:MORN repeat protein n=1 Tax=Stentor coeruleus TaxID=5963 RepID=A0A1R2C376_9CILI|nr:hypothetical protein SteCoe_15637 [Stentor coeruleus]